MSLTVFRLAKTRYILDTSGLGAQLSGGRWNLKGTPVIYTSQSRSLALAEFLVHTPLSLLPEDLSILAIEIPKKVTFAKIDLSQLKKDWNTYPASEDVIQIGQHWVLNKKSCVLKVPSAIIAQEYNYILNPLHEDFAFIKFGKPEKFILDSRFKK